MRQYGTLKSRSSTLQKRRFLGIFFLRYGLVPHDYRQAQKPRRFLCFRRRLTRQANVCTHPFHFGKQQGSTRLWQRGDLEGARRRWRSSPWKTFSPANSSGLQRLSRVRSRWGLFTQFDKAWFKPPPRVLLRVVRSPCHLRCCAPDVSFEPERHAVRLNQHFPSALSPFSGHRNCFASPRRMTNIYQRFVIETDKTGAYWVADKGGPNVTCSERFSTFAGAQAEWSRFVLASMEATEASLSRAYCKEITYNS